MSGVNFDYCPSCSGDLDTGWECTKCELDWQREAVLRNEAAKPYDENTKLGFSFLFIFAFASVCVAIAFGSASVVAGAALFAALIIPICYKAAQSSRWST